MSSHDEFGVLSLDEMFPDLEAGDLPDIEAKGDFSGGLLHCSASAPYTETHLAAMLTRFECSQCPAFTLVGTGYSVRRLHRSRNQCIEFQSIMPFAIPQYDHLPRMTYIRVQSIPFCGRCSSSFTTKHYLNLSEGENE